MKDIIDHDKMEWKEEVAREISMPHDAANKVLKIRLPRDDREDFVSWHYEKSVDFSVRSAYKLALHEKINIWKDSVPPAVN